MSPTLHNINIIKTCLIQFGLLSYAQVELVVITKDRLVITGFVMVVSQGIHHSLEKIKSSQTWSSYNKFSFTSEPHLLLPSAFDPSSFVIVTNIKMSSCFFLPQLPTPNQCHGKLVTQGVLTTNYCYEEHQPTKDQVISINAPAKLTAVGRRNEVAGMQSPLYCALI